MFSRIAGIRDVEDSFRYFTLKPCIDCGLEYVKAGIKTSAGLIRCEWETTADGSVSVTAEIPKGSTAHIVLEKNG